MTTPPAGRYRRISLRMYADAKYRRLSDPQPCGKALWHHLLFGPHTGIIPGVSVAGEAQLAETLKWELKAFREAFREVSAEDLAKADWQARLIWIPNALKHNPPQSPNVIRNWRDAWLEVPECALKVLVWQSFRDQLKGLGEAFLKAFIEAFDEAMAEPGAGAGAGLGLQRQEQEKGKVQEGEAAPPKASPPPATPGAEVLLEFPVQGKGPAWQLTSGRVAAWAQLYPDMDILAECRKALANVEARGMKTAGGMPAYLVNWFNRGVNQTGYTKRDGTPSRGNGANGRAAPRPVQPLLQELTPEDIERYRCGA